MRINGSRKRKKIKEKKKKEYGTLESYVRSNLLNKREEKKGDASLLVSSSFIFLNVFFVIVTLVDRQE